MAYHFVDNVHSRSLTPKEPNVELLDASCERNIIVCLGNSSGNTFIATKLTQHIVNQTNANESTLILYIADSPTLVSQQAACFQRLTDIIVRECHKEDQFKRESSWKEAREDYMYVMETQVAVILLKKQMLTISEITLMILHGCHSVLQSGVVPMKELMKFYFESLKKPHILSLATSLFSSKLDLSQMNASLNKMEDLLDCKAETASNVLSVLRYGTQPHEAVLEYDPPHPTSVDQIIENEIMNAINFIRDHRYDPLEMYEGFTEELQNIPDPKCDPEEIFLELLDVLHTLGPWSTDRAALVLLFQLEKLKVTTPYERHFLLLCMTSSVLIKIRAILDDYFRDVADKDRIYNFSSPKVLRVIEILRKFVREKSEPEVEVQSLENGNVACDKTVEDSEVTTIQVIFKLGANRKCFSCDCDIMTEFLQKRLQYPILSNVTYTEFVQLVNTKNLNERQTLFTEKFSGNKLIEQTDKVTDTKVIQSESRIDKNISEDKPFDHCDINTNRNSNQKIFDGFKKKNDKKHSYKNGFLSFTEGETMKAMRDSPRKEGKKINESSTLENFLQYQECLLLPKFKIDRHARYDRFNASNQFKKDGQDEFILRQMKCFADSDVQLCGLIIVKKKFTAKVLFHVLNDLRQSDEDFSFLSVQFTVGKSVDGAKDPKGAENEHRKQELMLKKFRMRVCNLLIGTSFLEEGIDLPKCNLVIRFDMPENYRSYINTKERARATDSLHCLLVDVNMRESFVKELGRYYETESMLLSKCGHLEPSEDEEKEADRYSQLIEPFCPLLKKDCPHVDLSSAIALVNRYCAKLPSDTFTRLTPIWKIKTVEKHGEHLFVCTIQLPINSPVKKEIEGCPMPTVALARRFAALQCCQILHFSGELDDTLQPISKESFWIREEEQLTFTLEEMEEMLPKDSLEPRPGTTKRRQYYYKRIADSLTDCLPIAGTFSYLYDISMALTCPLPEEQNTRGRKIHPPEESSQGFGILTRKSIPKIGSFPIFTRSGEVQVKLQLTQSKVILTELQIRKIVAFIHYTFTSVLRLQKYLMMFDPNSSENSYFIVPTKKVALNFEEVIEVDWNFLELIYEKRNQVPKFIPEAIRKDFEFDSLKFEDAVVSPWYRNQDQPQYLYVAEICANLNPSSAFPGTEYKTFEEYYLKKYNIRIQNNTQSLLDVDHTSARLNFLTPRYVNRKGVALPTTSEEKKRAKRENLKQKQILIPELCDIHPFPATLWRKAVCLPCILHRINALLLADEVRRIVATEIGVGSIELKEDFNWQPLNFGWSLADVLKQTKAFQKQQDEPLEAGEGKVVENYNKAVKARKDENCEKSEPNVSNNLTDDQIKEEDENQRMNGKNGEWIEIGTWSNEMANFKSQSNGSVYNYDNIDKDISLPKNVTMIEESDLGGLNGWNSEVLTDLSDSGQYHSPTKWMSEPKMSDDVLTDYSSDSSFYDDFSDIYPSSDTESASGGFKIEFKEENVAEAIENHQAATKFLKDVNDIEDNQPWPYEEFGKYSKYVDEFNKNVEIKKEEILKSEKFFNKDKPFDFIRKITKKSNSGPTILEVDDVENISRFGTSDNTYPKLVEEVPDDVKNLSYTPIIVKSLEAEKTRLCNKRETIVNIQADWKPRKFEHFAELDDICKGFSFDEQPELDGHPGPSPSLILQALTMSNANDGINLERLETIGDSFLKYAITTYLYCVYEDVHEGKLSHLRSKQVSNFNLYRLGRRKMLGESMIATKFEPHDNWLPPCYYVPRELERALIEAGVPASHWNRADLPSLRNLSKEEICQLVREKGEKLGIVYSEKGTTNTTIPCLNLENMPCFIPYNLMTQHSIPDKSIADCVEALIGAYLVACGPRGALLFMSWLGIKVLPKEEIILKSKDDPKTKKGVGSTLPVLSKTDEGDEMWSQIYYGKLKSPKQPLLRHLPDPDGELERLLRGFDAFEDSIKYRFRDRSYLLQALSHASFSTNRLTDCYQRLEFLGDAVLDYLITRHLYEDPRHHSPGALTDLRSALVNNTIFAALAVRHNFHKYFRHLCPTLNEVVDRFVRFQQENGHSISEEFYLIEEEECEESEDVEVPKALGDIFESVAGAIFLDSEMSLDAVWKVYYRIMKNEIELFSTNVPKSPIRELFELEPETAQFGKPEKLADGRRVRVTVEVFGKGSFSGIGRNYRIAKCTAAKCALKQLKQKGLLERRK